MKKIDLSLFPTEALEILRSEIKEELFKRKRSHRAKLEARIFDFLKSEDPTNISKIVELIFKFNSSDLLKIPMFKERDPNNFLFYLPSLLAQDWSKLYPCDINHGEYYVYAHVDPRLKTFIATEEGGGNYGGQPFYIGKGIGNRAFDLKRNEGHGKIIREILRDSFDSSSIIKIVFSGLSEQKALEIESKLIYYFGVIYSKHRKGWLINLNQPILPKFVGTMKAIPPEMVFRGNKLSLKEESTE